MTGRRRFSRFEPDDAEIWLSVDEAPPIRGTVVNESFGGLGIRCPANDGLQIGCSLVVEYQGATFDATVTSVAPQADGDILVGIEWEP